MKRNNGQKIKKIVLKTLKISAIVLGALLLLMLATHYIGAAINKKVPEGGINESMYVDINGTKQWISIYGTDRNNPVLLYLHGGPSSSTSIIDYPVTRQWADIYTVVTWDQRNCGKSYNEAYNGTTLTRELFMEDGKEMTEFILEYLGVEKITILGHSWGSLFGANLVLEHPEYYDCFIGTGQVVDLVECEQAFKDLAAEWAEGDEETLKLVEQLTPESITMSHVEVRNALYEKFDCAAMRDGYDTFLPITVLCNPYYSPGDWIQYLKQDISDYLAFFVSDEFKSFSLKGRYDYKVPFYNINGDNDYQANYLLANDYFAQVNAPSKQLFIMNDTAHGLLFSKSHEFSSYLHQIAKLQE